jgi:prepilin-type N-terminal cleavage/methylation domain-containing protein
MKKGFSLIELVVVLVIIGLIVGGITSGQNLIRSAQLQDVVIDIKRFESATAAFQERYFQLPGDMTNATDFWGFAHTTASSCGSTSTTDGTTCNGDGNGQIIGASSVGGIEQYRFWQHLANAGLIEGSFTGATAGENVATISSGYYTILYETDSTKLPISGSTNAFSFGALNNVEYVAPVITPEEAWNIDKKIDDGKPNAGSVLTWLYEHNELGGAFTQCIDTVSTFVYNLDDSSTRCGMAFVAGF